MEEYIVKLNDQIAKLIGPYLQKMLSFIGKTEEIVLAAIAVLLVVLVIAGLFACLKRIPKLFILLVFLLGAVVGAWYLLGA